MKQIPLYPLERNVHAFVDAADYDCVKRHRWYAKKHGTGTAAFRVAESEGKILIISLHAEIFGRAPKGMVIDHKNRNPLDCRRENLRLATRRQNAWNRAARPNRKYSRYKGIYFAWRYKDGQKISRPKPWYAQLEVNGKSHFRGYFANERDAYEACTELMQELHGEFACIEPWEGHSNTPALRKLFDAVKPCEGPEI